MTLALAVLVSLTAGCRGEPVQKSEPPLAATAAVSAESPAVVQPAVAAFVGSSPCQDCHPETYDQWSGSHHALAMQVADSTTVLGDFNSVSVSRFGVRTEFSRRGDLYFVRTEGSDGEQAEFSIQYVFGVQPLQQYLVELPGGRLQALTWAWDTREAADGGQRWFSLDPDERVAASDVLHWTGPAYGWNLQCADCHSTDLQKKYQSADSSYQTTFSEINVACEACHGPASVHVTWANAAESGDDISPAVVESRGLVVALTESGDAVWKFDGRDGTAHRDPPLSSERELGACAPCHSRRSPIAAAKIGSNFLDTYRPALLESGLYFPDGQILDEVYVYGSFLQSKMYRAGVRCSDCHNSHTLALKDAAGPVCHKCHAAQEFEAPVHNHHEGVAQVPGCVDCHMPSRTYMGVDVRHDHSFRIPRPDLSVSLGTPNTCNQCHTDRDAQWSVDRLDEWSEADRPPAPHFARSLEAGRQGRADAAAGLRALGADTSLAGIVRATAMSLLEGYPDPTTSRSIHAAVSDEDPLLRWAAARAAFGLPVPARAAVVEGLLKDPLRLVRIEAARTLAAVPPGSIAPDTAVALKDALSEYRSAQRLESDRPGAHANLASLDRMQGDLVAAERGYRQALKTGSYFIPAYIDLADLYRELQRDGEAEQVLSQGLALAPDSAELNHAAGLAAVRGGELDTALRYLRKAYQLDRSGERYAYVYAVALHSADQLEQALDTLKAALKQRPASIDLLYALTTMHRDANRLPEALAYALKLEELAPDNPTLLALRQGIESRL